MESAMAAPTEDTVATLGDTGPMEATMARGRLSLLLLPRLKPILTMALTDTVDFPMDALTEDMVATDVATTARGRLRLLLRLRLLTDTAMVAAMEAMEATAAPMEDM